MKCHSTVGTVPIRIRAQRPRQACTSVEPTESALAAARQRAQLPGFAPLLEELEVAGWSSHRQALSGNFHDWMLLEPRKLLVVAGHATSGGGIDPIEAALVAQGTWAAIRSHARHATDAGTLFSLASRTLWPVANGSAKVSIVAGIIDLDGGHASIAAAGDCMALKIRATGAEPVGVNQPAIGTNGDFPYSDYSVQLSLRDRIVLIADEPARRPAKFAMRVANGFERLDAESHRRMMAADAVALVRALYQEPTEDELRSASIVAVRRR